jgi:hypothetical protein
MIYIYMRQALRGLIVINYIESDNDPYSECQYPSVKPQPAKSLSASVKSY